MSKLAFSDLHVPFGTSLPTKAACLTIGSTLSVTPSLMSSFSQHSRDGSWETTTYLNRYRRSIKMPFIGRVTLPWFILRVQSYRCSWLLAEGPNRPSQWVIESLGFVIPWD